MREYADHGEVIEPPSEAFLLPNIVICDPSLSPVEFMVYSLVASADQREGICLHRPALLAHNAKCSIKRAEAALSVLEARRLIVRATMARQQGWHAPLDIVDRASVTASGVILLPLPKEADDAE